MMRRRTFPQNLQPKPPAVRFRTVRSISAAIFVLAAAGLLFYIYRRVHTGAEWNIRFALVYVFAAVVLAGSMATVIGCTVILRQLRRREAKDRVRPTRDEEPLKPA